MFEHHTEPLPSRLKFLLRFAQNFLAGTGIVLGSLLLGMVGYHYCESMNWTDAYLNAAMLLSGMGPISSPQTEAGKLFAATYALYSGFVVILATGIVFAPVLHRLLHRFHLSGEHRKRTSPAANPPSERSP